MCARCHVRCSRLMPIDDANEMSASSRNHETIDMYSINASYMCSFRHLSCAVIHELAEPCCILFLSLSLSLSPSLPALFNQCCATERKISALFSRLLVRVRTRPRRGESRHSELTADDFKTLLTKFVSLQHHQQQGGDHP